MELKIHFGSKLISIQQLNEEDHIKSMYIEYIIKRTTWLHVCVHETLPKCNKQCKVGEGHLNSYFYKNSKFYKVCNDSKSNVCFNIMVGFGN